MRYTKTKRIIGFVVMLTVFSVALAAIPARAADHKRAPELPPLCSDIQVPAGHKVAFHVYARGVQIYRWDGNTWAFVAPVATLFSDAEFTDQVGIHYAGPRWESNSGSIVRAANAIRCDLDPANDIPWLRLQAVETKGPGIFSSVTYIHRVNTHAGLAPTAPGSSVGASIEIPYTAEYFFYREEN